jgi:two-component system nitrate/nitrite response regulator NarL
MSNVLKKVAELEYWISGISSKISKGYMVAQVFLVGAQPSRERLKGFLATSALIAVGGSSTLAEAHSLLCNHGEAERADILLLDIDDRLDDDAAVTLRAIRGKQPAMKIVVLGDPSSLAQLSHASPTGIDGYLLHDMPRTMLLHALDLIMSGTQILPPCSRAERRPQRVTSLIPIAANAPIGLSTAEAQILQQFLGGSSSKAIARDLAISGETVKVHLRAILGKLKARNRTEAALWSIEHGFDRSTIPGQFGVRSWEAMAGQADALNVAGEAIVKV